MARFKGTFEVPANYEPQKAAPFDARQLVENKSDLFLTQTWQDTNKDMWLYNGMLVSVSGDTETNYNGIYWLIDKNKYNQSSGWQKLADDSAILAIKAMIGEITPDTTLVTMINKKADQSKTYTKTEIDNLLAELDQFEANNAIIENTKAIAKNTVDIAALDEILKIALENNKEGLDSIKELAIWAQEHETKVFPIINKHTTILEGIGEQGEKPTVKAYIDDAIAAITSYELPVATLEKLGGIKSAADIIEDQKVVKATNAIYVNPVTAIGEVKAVSTDILVQGENELILNGGKAPIQ